MPKYIMEMVLEYAKVFPENADMGNPEGNKLQKDIHNKGGQYVLNAYFTKESQIEDLLVDGMIPKPLGHERFIQGNAEFGIGKFIKLKRDVQDKIMTFTNNKKGTTVDVNYGGAPKIVDLRNGRENKRWWSYEEDGSLGNGTTAMVEFSTYKDGAGVRLESVGVLDLVPYESQDSIYEEHNALFEVD